MTEVGRVLVVTNDFPPRRGGIEAFIFSLCQGLPPEAVVVYTARMKDAEAVDGSLAYPVVRDRARVLLPTPRVRARVRATMIAHECDHVVFGAAAPLGLLASSLRRSGARTVIAITHGHETWWAKVPGARRLLRRIGAESDVVTYVSDYCRREISTALTPEAAVRMTRLAPGVDPQRFRPGRDTAQARRPWGIAVGAPVVLAASRLVTRKGHDVLIEAWPTVLAACPGAVLLIVGSGPRRGHLRRAVRRLGLRDSVHIRPSVPWSQMPDVYATADVFALPCRTRRGGLESEALGIVFLEAASCGLPVVVGRSGGAPETVVDGESGYVVDPRDVGAVAGRIVSLLTRPIVAAAMGHRGRRLVETRWSEQATATVLARLLDS